MIAISLLLNPLHRDGEAIGEGGGGQQRRQADEGRRLVRGDGEGDRSCTCHAEAGGTDGGDDSEDARRRQDAVFHRSLPVKVVGELLGQATERDQDER